MRKSWFGCTNQTPAGRGLISNGKFTKTGGPCRAFFREFGGPGVRDPLRRAAKYSGGWSKPLRDRVPDGIWERDEGVEVVNQNRPLFNA